MKRFGPARRAPAVCSAAAIALLLAGGAAASPKAGAQYSGKGPNYNNNASRWTKEGTGKVSFRTSAKGADVLAFSGSYSCYCNCQREYHIRDAKMAISKSGHFSSHGHFSYKTGTAYESISGRFERSGRTAKVSYLYDFVWKGKHVKNPYSTKMNSAQDACEALVRATAHWA